MNIRKARKYHDYLNRTYFFGLLPMPVFKKISGNVGYPWAIYGFYDDETKELAYNKSMSDRRTRETIAHEMVHQFQDFAGFPDLGLGADAALYHGFDFWNIALLIQKRERMQVI
jgi:hypothetical protein